MTFSKLQDPSHNYIMMMPPTYVDHDLAWSDGVGGVYHGDTPLTTAGGCIKHTADTRYGLVEYEFTDTDFGWSTPGSSCDDGAICIGPSGIERYEIWIMPARTADYGAANPQYFWIKGTLVWSGLISPGTDPSTICYHVTNWAP